MRYPKYLLLLFSALLLLCGLTIAQTSSTEVSTVVPRLVNFSGKAVDAQGKPISGIVGVTFAIYKDQYEGAPLWMETQNVTADGKGNYAVQLGAATASGLPLDLFSTGEARWLGVTINGGQEQPRVLLLSVPYALKAADAQTLGGLPPSAFVLAAPANASNVSATGSVPAASSASAPPPASADVTTTGGRVNAIPLFSAATNIQNSILTQTGTTAVNVVGKLNLPTTGVATATAGKNSRPESFVTSVFNSGTATAVPQTFLLQAEPAGNDTATPSGTLNLLYASGATTPAETGLKISNTGLLTFATGQTFPGTGHGTITGVTAGTALTGGGTTGAVTLNLDTTKVPLLAAANTFTGNQTVSGNLTATGNFSSGPITASTSSTAPAIAGNDTSVHAPGGVVGTSAYGYGVSGTSGNNSLAGVYGSGYTGVEGDGYYGVIGFGTVAVFGGGNGNDGIGVQGSGIDFGVYGSSSNVGVYGNGVNYGVNATSNYTGVYGSGDTGVSGSGTSYGLYGTAVTTGVYGSGTYGVSGTGSTYGVLGESANSSGSGGGFSNSTTGDALFTYNQSGGYAAFFDGNVDVDGNLSKAGGSFKIDDPLDPENKYLYHSFVESPDMKNIYDGNVTTDGAGNAVVTLPKWFETLNRDFRYQLTVIGQFAQAIVAKKVEDNQFQIRTSLPNVEVSWQVTGIRQDPWANANRIPVEEEKDEKLKGFYLHPEVYGAPVERGIAWARHPEMMKKLLQDQNQKKPAPPIQSPMPAKRMPPSRFAVPPQISKK